MTPCEHSLLFPESLYGCIVPQAFFLMLHIEDFQLISVCQKTINPMCNLNAESLYFIELVDCCHLLSFVLYTLKKVLLSSSVQCTFTPPFSYMKKILFLQSCQQRTRQVMCMKMNDQFSYKHLQRRKMKICASALQTLKNCADLEHTGYGPGECRETII